MHKDTHDYFFKRLTIDILYLCLDNDKNNNDNNSTENIHDGKTKTNDELN